MLKRMLALCFLMASTSVVSSGEVWNADIRINKIEATKDDTNYTCKVEVQSDSDDDAWNAKLVILASPGVKIAADITFDNLYEPEEGVNLTEKMKNEARKNYSESSCIISNPDTPSTQQQNSNVTCDLGSLSILSNFTVEIKSNTLATNAEKKCAAFVFSETPDQNHENNYKSTAESD